MKLSVRNLSTGLALVAGVAIAAEATDPTVKAWQEAMDANGMAAKTLGDMAGGKTAFDAAAAAAARDTLITNAAATPTLFKTQASDPKSKAKAEIWANWADFEGKAKALGDAASAMDASTVEGVQAGMGAVGGACVGCHKAYQAS